LEQGIRSKEQGELSKLEGGGQKSENKPVGDLKNTGFSHPSVEQVVGDNTNNSGKVVKTERQKSEDGGQQPESKPVEKGIFASRLFVRNPNPSHGISIGFNSER
jgi:hypothetical protein